MNDQSTPGSEPSVAGREPKVIKRYTNRKLYDTVESRYVTLDEIAQMIKAGAEVQIIDNRTKEDLTSVTLAQIIFEEEKKTSKMSLDTLRDLIRHGGEVAQRLVEGTQAELRGRVEAVRAAAEQRAFAPLGPIFSSAIRNFAWQLVQWTIMRPRSGIADYTAAVLDTKRLSLNNPLESRTYSPRTADDERPEHPRKRALRGRARAQGHQAIHEP